MSFRSFIFSALATLLCFSAWANQLTPEQKAAKEKGIILYNQHKNAEPYLRIAAEAGDREAQYYLGEEIRHANFFMTEEAYKWYTAAAEQGDYYAMFRLATVGNDLCSVMDNCPENHKEPGDWLKLLWATAEPLANSGDAEAMMIMYNAKADLSWLEKSAEAGYAPAQYLLARRYEEGRSFFFPPWKRSERIEELAKKSAEGGYVKGIDYNLGLEHEKHKNDEKFISDIKSLSETGYIPALFTYAEILQNRKEKYKIKPDLVQALGLMSLIAELDGGGVEPPYARDIVKNELEPKMTPEQIEEAKAFAEEWKATHPPLSFFVDKLGF